MKFVFRQLLLYLIVSLILSILSFYIITSGADMVGDILLAMFLSPIAGFLLGVPISAYLYRFIEAT
ncbi:MAG: hypothetical protein RLP44_03685 [Aggregatilineales bacterium]